MATGKARSPIAQSRVDGSASAEVEGGVQPEVPHGYEEFWLVPQGCSR